MTGPKKRKMDNEMVWGTQNVQTMLQPGKMMENAQEVMKYKLKLVALQEIRWQGQGSIDKKDFTLIYSGPEKRTGQLGTGFIITRIIRNSLLEFESVNERLCHIRLKGKFRNLRVISVHTPTESKEEQEKEEFCIELEELCNRILSYNQIIMIGDFNS